MEIGFKLLLPEGATLVSTKYLFEKLLFNHQVVLDYGI